MFIKEFTEYIKYLNLTPNIEIKATLLRSDAKRGIMVMSPLLGFSRIGGIKGLYSGEIQIIVRDINPLDGYNIANQIYNGIPEIETELPTYKIKEIHPMGTPITYPLNDGAFYEHSINFYCTFIEK